MNERILVIPNSWVHHVLGVPGGIHQYNTVHLTSLLEKSSFRKRTPKLEKNETLRQLIAYAVLLDSQGRVFSYQRPVDTDYKESRLKGKWSIGVGGHIDFQRDGSRGDLPLDVVWRSNAAEIGEEVGLTIFHQKVTPKAFIFSDQTEVGRVHLGIVTTYKLWPFEVKSMVYEPNEVQNAAFRSLDELRERATDLESWSALIVQSGLI